MKVKFGSIITEGRGKIGGHVVSKNRGGAYMRTKVTPSNPRTAAQQANRSLLGALSASWSNLTNAVRASFDSVVSDWTSTNIFGDSVKPTGKNLFVALNKNLSAVGLPILTIAPAKEEMPILGLQSAVFAIGAGTLTILTEGNAPGVQQVVSATPILSNGTTFTKGKFRKIYNSEQATTGSVALFAAYVSRFGAPTLGANISVEVKLVLANGQMSVPETVVCSVIA